MEQILTILNYVSVIILFICIFITASQSSSRMQRQALLICVTTGMCTLGYVFRYEATDLGTYLVGQKLCYIFVTHAMFLVVLFILEYCRYSIPSVVKCIIHSINFIMSFIVLTLEYNKVFYTSITAVYENGQLVVEKEYGTAHTIALGLMVLYMLACIVITVIFMIKNYRKRNKYAWRILVAAMIPCMAYFIPKVMGLENDIENIAFAIFAIMLLYMIYRNKLYDVDNIAARLSFDTLEEAFIVIDNNYKYMGCNKMAMSIFPILKTVELDSDIRNCDAPFVEFFEERSEEYRDNGKIYSVTVRQDQEGHFAQGKVIRLEDVTTQRKYTELLQENKAQIEKDLAMAKSIQINALPVANHIFSNVPKLNVAAFMETAKDVGGDFYDFYMLDDKRAAFLIADVSGKGVPAAMFMMQAKAIIKNCVEEGLSVNDAFTQANERLCEGNDALMFVTAWMGILDVSTGIMSFANAGHNLPIIMRHDGSCEYIDSKVGFVLAGMEGVRYKEQQLELKTGDKLFLYTDGVTEATDNKENLYGEERLLTLLQTKMELSVDDTLHAVKDDIDEFVGEAEQFDDITMVMLQYTE